MKLKNTRGFVFSLTLFLFLSYITLHPSQAAAVPGSNLVFATVGTVQNMINQALAPIQTSINNLNSKVSSLAATVTPIPGQIASIQATLTPIPSEISGLQNKVSSQTAAIGIIQNAINSPAVETTFFADQPGFFSNNQDSPVIDVSGHKFMVLTAVWNDPSPNLQEITSQGSYGLYYSDDGQSWIQQDSLEGNAYNNSNFQRIYMIKGKYYKSTIFGTQLRGTLSGFID